jgi:hypothetical protein
MDRVAKRVEAARTLSRDARRRLVEELDALEREETPPAVGVEVVPLASLLAASGTIHAEFNDLSTNKYAHVTVSADQKR